MARIRGRTVAWVSGGVGALVITSLLWMHEERLFEEWQLYRLRSQARATRLSATRKLGHIGSARVITALYCIVSDPEEEPFVREAAQIALRKAISVLLKDTPYHPTVHSPRLKQPDT